MKAVGRCGPIAQQMRDQAKAVIYFCHVDLTATEWLCSFLTIPNLQRLPPASVLLPIWFPADL